jgi:hypothetical protein
LVVVRRNCDGKPSRKSAAALPVPLTPGNAVFTPLNVKSPFGRLMNAMIMCSLRTSPPNLKWWLPRVQVTSSVNCSTSLTRLTNGCWASPRLKNPLITIEARPGASGLVFGTLMPKSSFFRPLVTVGFASMRLYENRATLIARGLKIYVCDPM